MSRFAFVAVFWACNCVIVADEQLHHCEVIEDGDRLLFCSYVMKVKPFGQSEGAAKIVMMHMIAVGPTGFQGQRSFNSQPLNYAKGFRWVRREGQLVLVDSNEETCPIRARLDPFAGVIVVTDKKVTPQVLERQELLPQLLVWPAKYGDMRLPGQRVGHSTSAQWLDVVGVADVGMTVEHGPVIEITCHWPPSASVAAKSFVVHSRGQISEIEKTE